MVRIDTAGFWKYMNFYGHKKPSPIPIPDDPVTPVDPCSSCPEGYTCDGNGVCNPGNIEWNPGDPIPGNIDNRQPNKDESKEIIPTSTPIDDVCTQEYSLKSLGSIGGYVELENGFITGADYNSGVRYYLSGKDGCWSKVAFEGRIGEIDSTGYNRIEYGFWDINRKIFAISNISSVDANNPNDRFRITLKNNGDYLIEVQRVISSSEMYDWTIYKSGNCLEEWSGGALDYSVPMGMIMGVNGKALLTSTIRYENASEYIVVLYDTDKLKIKHNISKKELTLIDDNGDSITMMDRNLGATAYYQEEGKTSDDWVGNFYDWGNNYGFTKNTPEKETEQVDGSVYGPNNPYSHNKRFIGNITTGYQWWIGKTTAYPNMWGGESSSNLDKIGPCPEGYHIPTTTELTKAKNMLSNAMSILDYTICRFLLMPLTGARLVGGMNISKTTAGYYWACNVPGSLSPIFNELQAYQFAFGEAQSGRAGGIERVPIGFSCCIRPFKNKADDQKYTIRFLNFDGTVLQSSRVAAGSIPEYTGSTPTKPSDQQYSYIFIGWSPAITIVSGDQTYTAQYTPIMEGECDFSNNSMTKDEIKALFNVTASGLDFNLTTDGIVPKNRSSSDSISLTTKNVRTGDGVTIQSIEVWYEVESGSGGNNLTEILSNQNYMSHTNYATTYSGTGKFMPNISVSGAVSTQTTARYGGRHPSGGQIYVKIDSEGVYGEYKDTHYNHTLTYSYTAEVAQQFLEILKNNGGLQHLRIMPRGRASIKNFKYKVVA